MRAALAVAALAALASLADLSRPAAPPPSAPAPPAADEDAGSPAEMLALLRRRGVADADWWVAVAVTESGHAFRAGGCALLRNPFGMGPHRRPTAVGSLCGCAAYASHGQAADDVRAWAALNPRRAGEAFPEWLRRRRYNPNDSYYPYIRNVYEGLHDVH